MVATPNSVFTNLIFGSSSRRDFGCDNEEKPSVLKTGLIHLLTKFHGLAGEDPHKHLKQFHIVCSTMKPTDFQEDLVY